MAKKDKPVIIGNIIVLVIALLFLGIGIYTATVDGTSINEAVKASKPWQWLVSAISFLGTVGWILYLSVRSSKYGDGVNLGKIVIGLILLATSLAIWYA